MLAWRGGGWQVHVVSYPLHAWRKGDEVYALHLNRGTTPASWRVALKGKVVAVERTRIQVRSRRGEESWIGMTDGPLFPTLAKAEEWATGNPPVAPGISPRTSR